MKNIYELGLLLYPSLTESEAEQALDDVKTKLGSAGAEIASQGEINYIDLEYQMVRKIRSKNHRFDQAYFTWLKFGADKAQMAEIKKINDQDKNILRFLLVETVASDEATNKFIDPNEEVDTKDEQDDLSAGVDLGGENVSADSDEAQEKGESKEDLTQIEGIGPKIAEVFAEAGIISFADLKATDVKKLEEILEKEGLSNHDPSTWPAQANLAFEGDWEELKALQEELDGGKK